MDMSITEGFEVDLVYSRYLGRLSELCASARDDSVGPFNYVMIMIGKKLHTRFFFTTQEDATAFALKWL